VEITDRLVGESEAGANVEPASALVHRGTGASSHLLYIVFLDTPRSQVDVKTVPRALGLHAPGAGKTARVLGRIPPDTRSREVVRKRAGGSLARIAVLAQSIPQTVRALGNIGKRTKTKTRLALVIVRLLRSKG
jgi:hypothetical protein